MTERHVRYPFPVEPQRSITELAELRRQLDLCPPWARGKLRLRWHGVLLDWVAACHVVARRAAA